MYVPKNFEETDQDRLHEFMENHSFATVISHVESEPVASHLPLLLDRDGGPCGRLIGHMARANPQWRQAEGQKVLTIFHGPHAYVSPTLYKAGNVVPTWNYVAVHAHGTLRLETNRQCLLQIVQQYVDFYESTLPKPWSLDKAEFDFINRLVDAIVGFEIVIDRIEGKWKLNQNHDETRRANVIRALRDAGGEDQRQIAALMSETLED